MHGSSAKSVAGRRGKLIHSTYVDRIHQALIVRSARFMAKENYSDKKMKLSQKDRKKLIYRVSHASGIAQYALDAKMTDDNLIEAANNLKILILIQDANNYNRYCQSQKTADANARLRQFIDPSNSEIYKTGLWLVDALSKVGQNRKQTLLQNKLVHLSDYNEAITDLKDTIQEQANGVTKLASDAKYTISTLEKRNDSLRKQLMLIQNYITNNHGINEWCNIKRIIQNQ